MSEETSSSMENPQNGEPLQPNAEMVNETKFTDINIDCQEQIFKHLGLVDLLNIADTSKHFKTAANLVFAKKFGNEQVKVIFLQPCRRTSCRNLFPMGDNDTIGWIHFAKTILQLLRNFGHFISDLDFAPTNVLVETPQGESFPLLYKCAIEYINQYCADSLTKIVISHCPKGYLKFLKPLPNVQTLEIDSFGFEGLGKDSLITLFPALNRLKYIDFNRSLGIIENHFPHLEHLSVQRGAGSDVDPWDSISPVVLDLNPQLCTLFSFDIGSDPNVLRSMINLQHLENLGLVWDMKYATPSNEFNGETFLFQNVKTFNIFSFDTSGEYGTWPKIPFVLDQLEKCNINAKSTDFEQVYEFLNRNPTIVDLNLQLNCYFLSLTRIGRALPSLRRFKFVSYASITKEVVVDFVSFLPSLENADITFKYTGNFEELKQHIAIRLQNEWQILCEQKNDFTIIKLLRSA